MISICGVGGWEVNRHEKISLHILFLISSNTILIIMALNRIYMFIAVVLTQIIFILIAENCDPYRLRFLEASRVIVNVFDYGFFSQ